MLQLPIDMENYMEYHIMGSVSQIRLKPGCLPSKFDSQPDRRMRTNSSFQQPNVLKKLRKMVIEECLNESIERSIPTSASTNTSGSTLVCEDTSYINPGDYSLNQISYIQVKISIIISVLKIKVFLKSYNHVFRFAKGYKFTSS